MKSASRAHGTRHHTKRLQPLNVFVLCTAACLLHAILCLLVPSKPQAVDAMSILDCSLNWSHAVVETADFPPVSRLGA